LTLPSLVLAAAAAGLLLFLAERRWPLRRPRAALLARLAVNLLVAAVSLAVAGALVRPLALRAMGADAGARFGLLPWMGLPPWAGGVLGFLLLDLTFYWWHRANHRVPLLWRFHNVHHLDPDLDVSTALRFHFVEIALSAGFRVGQVVLIGVGPMTFWLYELCLQGGTLFHHSNVRLPIRVERALSRLLVTPRMHGIHHSQVEAEASANYGVVLPWWDRLHRTLRLNVPQGILVIGVPGYSSAEDNSLRAVLLHPFRRQRDHWRLPDGRRPEREPLPGRASELVE
jgi:sterol desaturase/sphingolipid hydroxylase (fatty acid hydroxylase superfamily)